MTTVICFAILAHADEDVLQNQVDNIRACNPDCKIVLYNGGTDPDFGKNVDIEICPYSRPLKMGKLTHFLIDTVRWLEETGTDYKYVVSVDSDLLFLRTGFKDFLDSHMDGYDCMGINMGIQRNSDEVPHWYPGQCLWEEWEQWQPFFQIDYFCGTLNCMQVYRHRIVTKILANLDWDLLDVLLNTTQVYAMEELLLPTLAVRCGGRHRSYPYQTADYVRTGEQWCVEEVKQATLDSNAFFIHPVNRCMDDEIRCWIQNHIAQRDDVPSSLVIVWGCYQGGVETAMLHRLRAINSVRESAHAYFYYGGAGLNNFQNIPYQVSNDNGDLVRYVKYHSFQVITFVNTLYNLDNIINSGFNGTCIFECHGFAPQILEELHRINIGEDKGRIRGVVVPGQHVKAQVVAALWKRPEIEIFVAPNMVDTRHMSKYLRNDLTEKFNIKSAWNEPKFIGWVGRLDNTKNWRLLLRIFRKVKETHDAVKLLVVGDITESPDVTAFFRKAHKYRLVDDLVVFPNVSYKDMPAFYSLVASSGGVLLSTSASEGYPYHLVEAQACECPVICTMAGGSTEIVAHGSTGFVFAAQDIPLAVEYINRMFTQPGLRQLIVSQAREKVCFQNDVERNVADYIRWLRHIVTG